MLRLVCVRAGRKFLNERSQGGARFRHFSVLSQFRGGFVFGQSEIDPRLGRHFAALFFLNFDVLFENEFAAEPISATENDDREKKGRRATSWIKKARAVILPLMRPISSRAR